jgi:hypothetical protein
MMRFDKIPVDQPKNRMPHRYIFIFIVVGLLVLTGFSPCPADVVETFESGSVNWTQGSLSAAGKDVPDERNHRPKDCQKAMAAARMAAFQQLLETVKTIRIDSGTRVSEFAEKNDGVMAKLMDMVKDADIVKQEYLTSGTADVGVRMSLFGGFSQLVLPAEIEHVESVKPVAKKNRIPVSENPVSDEHPEKEIYSGLIVDARGLGITPVMTPKIFDESLQEAYGPAFVSRETAVQKGMCRYTDNIDSAKKHPNAGDRPLTVKGLRPKNGHGADIIISNADALKLKSASEHLVFLKQCNVIIVVDVKTAEPDDKK